MCALENEIKKYERRGYEVKQKMTLKHGKKVVLNKKRGAFKGYYGRYIYYVDGNGDTRNISEFLKDYSGLAKEQSWDTKDKGIFICSGELDKEAFRNLRSAWVEDTDIRRTISFKTLSKIAVKKRKVEEVRITDKMPSAISKNVFIVHGRDDKPALELANILEKDFNLNPIILREKEDRGDTVAEKLERYSDNVGYAFVILTPDDIGALEEDYAKGGKLHPRARQNVVMEFGYFWGLLNRSRVCCLIKGEVEKPSDILGIIYKPFKHNVSECYRGIVRELKAAGHRM